MKHYIDYLLKEKKELTSVILLGISILLAVLMVFKITNFFKISTRAQSVVKEALEKGVTQPEKVDLTQEMAVVSALSLSNPFGAVPASPTNPIREVNAIFGDKALINGGDSWYAVGDTVAGTARIVAVEPTQVTIEWNGMQNSYRPVDATIPSTQNAARSAPGGTMIQGAGAALHRCARCRYSCLSNIGGRPNPGRRGAGDRLGAQRGIFL